MPVHNWTRVDSGIFHDFHQRWIISISNILNGGLLPCDYYAMAVSVHWAIDLVFAWAGFVG